MATIQFFDGLYFDGDFFDPFCYDENFFDGQFFDGSFFDAVCTIPEAAVETRPRPDDGPHKKRKSIYKPTGLPPIRDKSVEKRIVESEQIQAEVRSELQQKIEALAEQPKALDDTIAEMSLVSLADMSAAEIDFEIGVLLAKQFRTNEEETLLMILAVAAT